MVGIGVLEYRVFGARASRFDCRCLSRLSGQRLMVIDAVTEMSARVEDLQAFGIKKYCTGVFSPLCKNSSECEGVAACDIAQMGKLGSIRKGCLVLDGPFRYFGMWKCATINPKPFLRTVLWQKRRNLGCRKRDRECVESESWHVRTEKSVKASMDRALNHGPKSERKVTCTYTSSCTSNTCLEGDYPKDDYRGLSRPRPDRGRVRTLNPTLEVPMTASRAPRIRNSDPKGHALSYGDGSWQTAK